MESNFLKFEDINIGSKASFEAAITPELVADFARMSGDYNPLHMNEEFAASTKFKKRVAHGFLAGSFLSRLVGMYLPGRHALYLSQTLNFKNPVFLGDTLKVEGKVTEKSEGTKVITIATKISKITGEAVLDGEAKVSYLI